MCLLLQKIKKEKLDRTKIKLNNSIQKGWYKESENLSGELRVYLEVADYPCGLVIYLIESYSLAAASSERASLKHSEGRWL